MNYNIDVILCCNGEPYFAETSILGYRIRYFKNGELIKTTDMMPEQEAKNLALSEIKSGCGQEFVGGILGLWLFREEK
jgi:hypothetical protein